MHTLITRSGDYNLGMNTPGARLNDLIFPLFLVLLSACQSDPNHAYIQGQWLFANALGDSRSGTGHGFYEWRFDNVTFSSYQEIALGKPETLYGYYRILSSEGDQIVLQLYDLDGTRASQFEDRMTEITLTLNREDNLLQIGRTLFYQGYTATD
jgi:hypothetical protein